ncbi:hypothetical protein V865_007465 [Kwoniella europaea PYCC6329]|uniref:Uncharacterized protein n=1 Tax=Kwoniella europaea PYCC6329 TaxID=1423913 RepID=A0AAX4KSW7_9TREE
MVVCVVNISEEVDTHQLELSHDQKYTGFALSRVLYYLADYGVQFISVSATEEDAVVTICWDDMDWTTLCKDRKESHEYGRGYFYPGTTIEDFEQVHGKDKKRVIGGIRGDKDPRQAAEPEPEGNEEDQIPTKEVEMNENRARI